MKKDQYCVDCQAKVTKKHQKIYNLHLVAPNHSNLKKKVKNEKKRWNKRDSI